MTLSRIVALIAAGTVFVALWGFLPPPTYPLLALSVGAPEAGVWLVVVSLAAAMVALAAARGRLRWATLLCAAATTLLSLLPLFRFPATARRFDAEMRAALGGSYLCAVPAPIRDSLRPRSLQLTELFTGLQSGSVRITRGVPVGQVEGIPLRADLYQPADSGTFPVVVQIYGGAWQRGAPADDGAFAAHLAARNYVVVAIDYRHAPRWQWPAQLVDVRTALTWVRMNVAQFDGDAGRLALIGRSSGAQLALVAAYTDTLPIRAVISYYGPVDLVDGYDHPPVPDPLNVQSLEVSYLGGTPAEQPERYRAASPVTYAAARQPPTLLIYAGRDNVVLPRFGRLLHDRLQAGGTTAALLEIPWAEHAFDAISAGPSAQLALAEVERFLAWALYGAGGTHAKDCTGRSGW
ncbi:MAG: alpha/beta hydrolase [Gemmatimonadota bacterium]|nr:alpha/beta hydrolase [Gemmatimonadota bacterium]